jgi:hypothetical protein
LESELELKVELSDFDFDTHAVECHIYYYYYILKTNIKSQFRGLTTSEYTAIYCNLLFLIQIQLTHYAFMLWGLVSLE